MIEKSKKNKKGVISEEDVSALLQRYEPFSFLFLSTFYFWVIKIGFFFVFRYTATTLLALLQEVAQFDGAKIDWNALVKKTSTGISNAREYQMLWRHLAYRHVLPEKFDDGAHPLVCSASLPEKLNAASSSFFFFFYLDLNFFFPG
jgi:hypothetical protein